MNKLKATYAIGERVFLIILSGFLFWTAGKMVGTENSKFALLIGAIAVFFGLTPLIIEYIKVTWPAKAKK